MVTKETLPWKEELRRMPIAALVGPIAGYVSAYINPFYIPDTISKAHNKEIDSLSEYIFTTAGLTAYAYGLYEVGTYFMEPSSANDLSRVIFCVGNVMGFIVEKGHRKDLRDRDNRKDLRDKNKGLEINLND